jgi:cobalt-zinc-cadmium efflux system outer membrane protein
VRFPPRILGLVAAGLLLGGVPVLLQGQQAGRSLTLGELYRQLASASPRLSAARASARAATFRIAPARTLPDPQLQLGLMNRNLPSLGLQDPLGMNQVQVMQMIPFPGKLGAAGRGAQAQADASQARAEDLGWELRSQAAMAFYEIYGTERSIAVALETQQLLRDIAATAQRMYAVGEGRQPDVLRTQVEINRMTEEILRMRTMRDALVARLNALLDQPPDAAVGEAQIPVFPAQLPNLDSLVALALGHRPMLQAGREDVRAAEAAQTLARREIWPDLQLGVIYGQRPMPDGGTDRMASFMFGFNLPVFAGSRQLKMRQETQAMRDMARADLAAMEADTRGRVGVALADLRQARQLQDLYRETLLPQARATVTSSLAAYQVGDINLMTLLDAQMTVNRYQQDLYRLEAAEGRSWAELEMLGGSALLDPDRTQNRETEPR